MLTVINSLLHIYFKGERFKKKLYSALTSRISSLFEFNQRRSREFVFLSFLFFISFLCLIFVGFDLSWNDNATLKVVENSNYVKGTNTQFTNIYSQQWSDKRILLRLNQCFWKTYINCFIFALFYITNVQDKVIQNPAMQLTNKDH